MSKELEALKKKVAKMKPEQAAAAIREEREKVNKSAHEKKDLARAMSHLLLEYEPRVTPQQRATTFAIGRRDS